MMESQTETKTQNPTTSSSNSVIEYSHEFKLEMENSIYNYFSKFKLEDDQSIKSLVRNETLVNNENKDVEYITPTPSLKGISEFMIDQIFSTDKIIPIESDDEESKLEITETVDEPSTETETDKKMSSCNSDVTLNNTVEELEKEEEKKNDNILDNEYISKSFAVEFIDLLNINMKELNSKKDDFHVIGLKNTNKENENSEKTLTNNENGNTEIKFKDDVKDEQKSSKKSRHMSLFKIEKKPSIHLHRSKSTNTSKSSSKTLTGSTESLDKELKKSKSKLGLSKLFRNVKKRIQKC